MTRVVSSIQIPLDPDNLGGPFVTGTAVVLAERDGRGIAEIDEVEEGAVEWVSEFDPVHFQRVRDGQTLKAIRTATNEDFKRYRVPIWIQDEEVPQCCGRPMMFVGQLDDNVICTEAPPGAKMWWHDAASFYIFTCPECLGVKAVGQQY